MHIDRVFILHGNSIVVELGSGSEVHLSLNAAETLIASLTSAVREVKQRRAPEEVVNV